MNIEEKIGLQDIIGFVVSHKKQSYHYFEYMHNNAKGSPAKRLMGKIASDEKETYLYYKKHYQNMKNSYSKDELGIITHFYISLLETPIFPLVDKERKGDALVLYTYDNAYDLFYKKSNLFSKFMIQFQGNFENSEYIELIKTILSKEQSYKSSLKLVVEKISENAFQNLK